MARIFYLAKTMVATQSSMQVIVTCSIESQVSLQACVVYFVMSSALAA